MLLDRIIRAWKEPEYRLDLSAEESAQLPENPAGAIELTDDELDMAVGGHHSSNSSSSSSNSSSRSNSSSNRANSSSNSSSNRSSHKAHRRRWRRRASYSWKRARR
jgi:mersacidin/lichenicidin family type 2 lantibiotic